MKENENCCCDMRGFLSFLILFLLSKKPMHGQEIAKEIEKRKGDKPSPGTIYPALKSLKESKLIKEKVNKHEDGKTIQYQITTSGKNTLRIARQRFCQTFKDIF